MPDDENQIMDVKLALLDLAIWSNNEHRARRGVELEKKDSLALVKLGTEEGGGTFAFVTDRCFYDTREEAYHAALKLAASGAERTK